MITMFSSCREGLPISLTGGTKDGRTIHSTSVLQYPATFSVLTCLMILLSDITSAFAAAGDLKWRYQTGGWVWSFPAIGFDGTVHIGSRDNYLYAIKPDGTLKWKYGMGIGELSPAIGSVIEMKR